MSEREQRKLLHENRHLRFHLDEDLQRTFNNDEAAYLMSCQRRDICESLRTCLQEKEKLTRHVDRQLAHLRKELEILSACAHDLAERTRRDIRRLDKAIAEAIDFLEGQGSGAENPNPPTPEAG